MISNFFLTLIKSENFRINCYFFNFGNNYFRFSEDLSYMIGDDGPGKYWEYTWKYLSPVCMISLFFVSIYDVLKEAPKYEVYKPTAGEYLAKSY